MNIEEVRAYCLQLPIVTEDMPFDDETVVFRIKGKIFALLNFSKGSWVNLKCDPEFAIQLREEFSFVLPGYHMNKKHWNTIDLSVGIPAEKLQNWIGHSYDLVVSKLTKKDRLEVEELRNTSR